VASASFPVKHVPVLKPTSEQVVFHGRWYLRVAGSASVLFGMTLCYLLGSTNHDSSQVSAAVLIGAVVGVPGMLTTSCIVIDHCHREIKLVNALRVIRINFALVDQVSGKNGVSVITTSDKSFGSFAYGQSNVARIFGDRAARRAAARIENELARPHVQPGPDRAGSEAFISFRWSFLGWIAGCAVASTLLCVIGQALQVPARL
jgi:hypothetical protein